MKNHSCFFSFSCFIKYWKACGAAKQYTQTDIQQITEALLVRLNESIGMKGGKLIIAYIPSPYEIREGKLNDGFEFIRAFCERENIPLINPSDELMNFPGKAKEWNDLIHWDSAGNKIIGEKIADYIVSSF